MTFGSLFSGIGGLDLGLEWAGMKCKWQVEIDDYCRRVLTKHWPDVPKYRDVREVGKTDWSNGIDSIRKYGLESVDLICGGFPCQPWSLAGKRRGVEDDRHLWPEMLRVVRELRPRFVLGENVPGIAPYLDTLVDDLEAEGYEVAPPLEVPAAAFDALHIRYRIFIIADDTVQRCRSRRPWGFDSSGTQECEPALQALADTARERRGEGWAGCGREAERFVCGGSALGDSDGAGFAQLQGQCADAESSGRRELGAASRWDVEPAVGRVAYGVPHRVDRLRGLGNAVVPQCAEWIGRILMQAQL